MKIIMFLSVLFTLSTSVFAQNKFDYKVLEPAVYLNEVNKDSIQFIDVRTPEEYQEGAIQGAENFDFLSQDFLKNMDKFDRDRPLYIYCRSGNRSEKAASQLSKMGFYNIIDLKGGYKAYLEFEKD